jgi:DNA-binding response OmpR family regulator
MSILQGKRILVVDDENGTRETIRMIVETEGAIVQTAVDGYDALKILENNSFELITTCLRMPRVSGLDLCREIQTWDISTPIVIVSASINPYTKIEIEGVVDIICKPFDLYDFKIRIEKALENKNKEQP